MTRPPKASRPPARVSGAKPTGRDREEPEVVTPHGPRCACILHRKRKPKEAK
jgi:hypothetical protein